MLTFVSKPEPMKKEKTETVPSEEIRMSPKIDYEEINRLIALLDEKNLSVFELEMEGFKIKIGRNPAAAPRTENAPLQSRPRAEESGSSALFEQLTQTQAEPTPNNIQYVTAPMVGTFYRAPDPASPPFVDIGEPVKKKQTLCIIEAMKLMNEIEAEVDGLITEIFVENGRPVEFGQRLFAVQIAP
jgi:acetyl-CoA carboxylase biotin carboxyl carrier protein